MLIPNTLKKYFFINEISKFFFHYIQKVIFFNRIEKIFFKYDFKY